MKLRVIIVCIGLLFLVGCKSIEVDGFSVGALYLDTSIETHTTNRIGGYGFETNQTSKIEEIVPILLINFKFK